MILLLKFIVYLTVSEIRPTLNGARLG